MWIHGSVHSNKLSTNVSPVIIFPLPLHPPWLPEEASLGVRVQRSARFLSFAGSSSDLGAS